MKAPMPETPPCPPLSKGLIAHLERVFPDVIPTVETTSWELGKRLGAILVIRYLQRVLGEQENKTTDVYQQPQHSVQ